MSVILEPTNKCDSIDNVIICYFGSPPDKISSIIDKQTQKAELANASSRKYYDRVKHNEEFVAKVLESKRKYYHNNKERLRQYYTDRLNNNDEIKQRSTQNKREHYEQNREAILERQRTA